MTNACLFFLILQDGEIDLKLLTNVLSPETEVFEVGLYKICFAFCLVLKNTYHFLNLSLLVKSCAEIEVINYDNCRNSRALIG